MVILTQSIRKVRKKQIKKTLIPYIFYGISGKVLYSSGLFDT